MKALTTTEIAQKPLRWWLFTYVMAFIALMFVVWFAIGVARATYNNPENLSPAPFTPEAGPTPGTIPLELDP